MAYNFRNVLLLSNLGADIGIKDFRLGSYEKTILPMARRLEDDESLSVRVMANTYIVQQLQKIARRSGHSLPHLATFNAPKGLGSFMINSFSSPLSSAEVEQIKYCLSTCLGDWQPDIILCWESPSQIFRDIFPECTVLDMMPSMFMRPPFPQMIAFDTCGLYGGSWLKTAQHTTSIPAALDVIMDTRSYFQSHFDSLDVPDLFEKLTNGHTLANSTLLPFQISQYFGWADTSLFSTQTDLMEAVHAQIPANGGLVCTQYTGSHLEEKVLTDANLSHWQATLPNLIFDPVFDKLDNFTQFLTPYASQMVSVSSTLGLQAKFFRKPLISPSTSHLSYIADSSRLSDMPISCTKGNDHAIADYLGRSCYLFDRLLSEPEYLKEVLESFVARRSEIGIDRFPDFETVGNTADRLVRHAKTDRSTEIFKRYADTATSNTHSVAIPEHLYSNSSVISFDVFDTLVCRSVLTPKDIFVLMQARLHEKFSSVLPESFIQGFAELRQSAERMLAKNAHEMDGEFEEITISQVYYTLAEDFDFSSSFCAELVNLEQEIELACLRPRQAGQRLFRNAQEAGLRIIILSDFIHDRNFVETVLRNCGYEGWEALYVSSAVGLKKHSGALFRHVVSDLGLTGSEIHHFGDNAHGDVEMARQEGWTATHLPSTPARVLHLCRQRPLNTSVVNASVFLGATLSVYARCYLDETGIDTALAAPETGLISTRNQLGFLAIGPAMYYFSRWILREAKQSGCQQIMLFARDTVLPYRILKTCFSDQLQELGITLCYIPISRAGSAGLDIHDAKDIWSIRVDDFDRRRPLTDLFEKRFLLHAEDIDTGALKQWTTKSLDTALVNDIPSYAIYRVAFTSAVRNSERYFSRLKELQDTFRRGLDQWGCNTDLKTIAVDIGYKGTLTRKVSRYFTKPLTSRFFASYANSLGGDPIADCKAFHLSRLTQQAKETEAFLKYNLVIETLLNESVGSVLGYHEVDEMVLVRRDPNLEKSHADAVTQLHEGALKFARVWHNSVQNLEPHLLVSQHMLFYTLTEILSNPTEKEAILLAPLVFDNSYAGHQPRHIVELSESGTVQGGIWPEGKATLLRSRRNSSGLRHTVGKFRVRLPHRLVRFLVQRASNPRLINKFDRDPYAFFTDSRNPIVRQLGRLLYS